MFKGLNRQMPDFLARFSMQRSSEWLERHARECQELCLTPVSGLAEALSVRLCGYDPVHYIDRTMLADPQSMLSTTASGDYKPVPFIHVKMPATGFDEPVPTLHLVLSAGGLGIGAGVAAFGKDQQYRFDRAIADKEVYEQLELALNAAKGAGCHLENLKRHLGEGSSHNGTKQLQNLEGLVVRNRNEPYADVVFEPGCVDWLDSRVRMLLPMQKWLVEHVCQT